MTNATKRNILLGNLKDGTRDIPIVGFLTWWNVRSVSITQKDFSDLLENCGLPTKYAREHNYRSAFTRALRNMEEKRIIRKVEESSERIVIQFTAESKVGDGERAKLEYDPETILIVDKKIYQDTKDFEKALTKGREDIKAKVVKSFYEEKVSYNSSDITRYVQNILSENADIISLRDQGTVYFVPAGYQDTLNKVVALVGQLGNSAMDFFPVPDTSASRGRISKSFLDEIRVILEKMTEKVSEVDEGDKEVTEKWVGNKIAEIEAVKRRIDLYSEILPESDQKELKDGFASLEERLNPSRKLNLGLDSEVSEDEPKSPKAEKAEGAAA